VTAKGVRILMAIHIEQSNHLANQQQVLSFVVSFASLSILCKPAKLACFNFSSPKFAVQFTDGVALTLSNYHLIITCTLLPHHCYGPQDDKCSHI
jgi:hypothetical protein